MGYVPTYQSFRFGSGVRMKSPLGLPTKTRTRLILVLYPQTAQIYTHFSSPQMDTDKTRMGMQILHP